MASLFFWRPGAKILGLALVNQVLKSWPNCEGCNLLNIFLFWFNNWYTVFDLFWLDWVVAIRAFLALP